MQDFLEIERSNELQQRQEYEIAKAQKLNREKVKSYFIKVSPHIFLLYSS